MSVCECRRIRSTLQSDGTRILEYSIVIRVNSDFCEFRQVYSSVHLIITTSHDQFSWFIIIKSECTITKLNGSQFRQVYSSISLQSIHSQALHENNHGMHLYQTEWTSNWASLFVTSFFENHSSIPRKHIWNCNSLLSYFSFQSLSRKGDSQSHTLHNQRRNCNQSSVLSVSHSTSVGRSP